MTDWREWRVCDMERELQKLTPREAYEAVLAILAHVRPMLSAELDRAEQAATQSATSAEACQKKETKE